MWLSVNSNSQKHDTLRREVQTTVKNEEKIEKTKKRKTRKDFYGNGIVK